MARIVVGIDASPCAAKAAVWAFDEARLRDADLVLVHTYTPDTPPHATSGHLDAPESGGAESEDGPDDAPARIIEEALQAVEDARGVRVERVVRQGAPAAVLCEMACEADLVVVGARGLEGYRGLLLGAVSQQVVARSPCPVVVVSPERTPVA